MESDTNASQGIDLHYEAVQRVTEQLLNIFAKSLRNEEGFQIDQRRDCYRTAFVNYSQALWQWVESLTPHEIKATISAAHLPPFENYTYLWWRAVYLAGMKKGEGFKPEHSKHFVLLGGMARRIGDDGIFQANAQKRWNYKKGKVQEGSTERQLKFYLLEAWLAGGLWRMKSRAAQLTALRKWWPKLPSYDLKAITVAQRRLDLTWSVK